MCCMHRLCCHLVTIGVLCCRYTPTCAATRARTSSAGSCAFYSSFRSTRLTRGSVSCSSAVITTTSTSTRCETATRVRGRANKKNSKNPKTLWKWVGGSSVQLEIKKLDNIFLYIILIRFWASIQPSITL